VYHLGREEKNTIWEKEKQIGNEGQRSSHGLPKIISWHLPEWTEETHEKPQTEKSKIQIL